VEYQRTPDRAFALLQRNPSLQFKKLHEVWPVKAGLRHRTLVVETPDGCLWIWIGIHAEYDGIAG
jgi:hypothetical protein